MIDIINKMFKFKIYFYSYNKWKNYIIYMNNY